MSVTAFILALLVGMGLLAALSRKWCLPVGAAGGIILAATLAAGILGIVLQHWLTSAWGLGTAVLLSQWAVYVASLLYCFYRDPDRVSPGEPGVLVSPADGRVIYVRRLAPGHVLESEKNGARLVLEELSGTGFARQELWQVGIAMVFTDVHVNRAPMAGRVTLVRHRPGKFLSLRREDALNANERQTLVIENNGFQLAIVQIASRLVRRIEAYVREGELLQLGQRIGIIKFGSQVDLFVPTAQVERLQVVLHQRLVAGETVIGRLPGRHTHAHPEPFATGASSAGPAQVNRSRV